MEECAINLDTEFKRYLQIMRPYLGQLVDQDIIDICNAWIQRLTSCDENEKSIRNKYVFALCYQLARGILSEPFLKPPSKGDLPDIVDEFDSECSTEVEYVVINADDRKTQVLFSNKKTVVSETELLSQEHEFEDDTKDGRHSDDLTHRILPCNDKNKPLRKQTIFCYTCPKMTNQRTRLATDEAKLNPNPPEEEYEFRATNLIMKLREIKKQNVLLHNELQALKEESKKPFEADDYYMEPLFKADTSTSVRCHADGTENINSLKYRLDEEKEKTNFLLSKIECLQQQLTHHNDEKRKDIEDLTAKHKLEIMKLQTSLREECHKNEEDHINQMKQDHENELTKIKITHKLELETMKNKYEENLREKEKQVEIKELQIANLKTQMLDQGVNLKTILSKIMEKPNESLSAENDKLKAQDLEKRLSKMEKSKAKCAKLYESKIACLQREKHLAECSLQLQLVRQRAQVVNEICDENQAELTAAMDKLETKYKEIVANVQVTAIQRRMQDQMALEAILRAACGSSSDMHSNRNNCHFATKTGKRESHDLGSDILSGLLRQQRLNQHKAETSNKSLDRDSDSPAYCLDGERINELLQRVYIPQRDTGDSGKT